MAASSVFSTIDKFLLELELRGRIFHTNSISKFTLIIKAGLIQSVWLH